MYRIQGSESTRVPKRRRAIRHGQGWGKSSCDLIQISSFSAVVPLAREVIRLRPYLPFPGRAEADDFVIIHKYYYWQTYKCVRSTYVPWTSYLNCSCTYCRGNQPTDHPDAVPVRRTCGAALFIFKELAESSGIIPGGSRHPGTSCDSKKLKRRLLYQHGLARHISIIHAYPLAPRDTTPR